jgi:acetylornithine deacetylase/succinyl-diaminopimelate desuccinylase-like protein
MPASTQDVLERIDRDRERHLGELKEFLRIPSISTDPQYKPEVLRAAAFLRDKMRAAGLESELVESPTGGNPLVYGEWSGAPGKPTVLFYGHYDVQPVDPIEEWRNPPFEPTLEGKDLVARGATDDKGQAYAHVKAVEAVLAERGALPVNVKFLVEGEEECGGESIEAYVRQDGGDRLACDCIVISDTSMYAPGEPAMLYGLKGLAYMEIRVQGPSRDLHSGTFGGAVHNPLNALAHILASLQDPETGRVLIDGFYDKVQPLEGWEREAFAALPFDEEEYRSELGVPELFGEEGYSTRERTWGRPTCDVNGMWGGYQGEGAKTVLPAKAGAKVSMRLVPDQDPEEIARLFRDHVERVAPKGVRVEVSSVHGAVPTRITTEGPPMEAAQQAMEQEWGAKPVLIREGGSIPIVATFGEVLQKPVLMMGFGLPDDGLHSPNEKFNVDCYHGGIRTVARFLDLLAAG